MLRLAVVTAAVWSLAALAGQFARARSFGRRHLFAPAAGNAQLGARYAFTKGMLPQAKESVLEHLPSYVAGMVFHAGVLVAFALLVSILVDLALPSPVIWFARVVTLAGAIAGALLLAKRVLTPHLRGLSCPDDYLANSLTTAFVALAAAFTVAPALRNIWLVVATLLLAYVPIGKIRHCFFFFPTRYYFGAFFGRRGSFPPIV
jgi:hypothetical protein